MGELEPCVLLQMLAREELGGISSCGTKTELALTIIGWCHIHKENTTITYWSAVDVYKTSIWVGCIRKTQKREVVLSSLSYTNVLLDFLDVLAPMWIMPIRLDRRNSVQERRPPWGTGGNDFAITILQALWEEVGCFNEFLLRQQSQI